MICFVPVICMQRNDQLSDRACFVCSRLLTSISNTLGDMCIDLASTCMCLHGTSAARQAGPAKESLFALSFRAFWPSCLHVRQGACREESRGR